MKKRPSVPGGDVLKALEAHVEALRACDRCPRMAKPVVSGGAVVSRVMLIGQAPGVKEPILGRPFAWTAGKTLFRWFQEGCGVEEAEVRRRVYFAAACRCFPGKNAQGGDRVPSPEEISHCLRWFDAEVEILEPGLIIPVGKLAINLFLPPAPLTEVIGKTFRRKWKGREFDLIPLPHPSGASPWHRMEPGRTLLHEALARLREHPEWQAAMAA